MPRRRASKQEANACSHLTRLTGLSVKTLVCKTSGWGSIGRGSSKGAVLTVVHHDPIGIVRRRWKLSGDMGRAR